MEDDDQIINHQQSIADPIQDSLAASLSSLRASSRGIPSGKDYHFFYNFEEFKLPLSQMSSKSQSLLEKIGSSSQGFNTQEFHFPSSHGALDDDAYDWLVNINDEMLERVDASLEEFQQTRSKEGEHVMGMEEGGFQMVYGKKKSKMMGRSVGNNVEVSGVSGVRMIENKNVTTKGKVRFHVPSIVRPQKEHAMTINNTDEPFRHVWIENSGDPTQLLHPLDKVSVYSFVDWSDVNKEPVKARPFEDTPFNYIDDVKGLKLLAKKLQGVNEFSIDLEHNHYRSYQGLTCLIQISTRDEDFILDALKLKILIGPHLRDLFKDCSKRKVMHGADRDVLWLQRDFGIYICNLFDTGQASKVLNLERHSLEYLLQKFCGVTANKEYQTADWRLRPLPLEMIKYAREDTHYLLQIYDMMRSMLLSMPQPNKASNHPLLEVYNRSSELCKQLYVKEVLTENSFLYVYGLQDAGFNAEQLSVASGLFAWRDATARNEDESTGFILPNKTLLEIAKHMPLTISKVKSLLKSKHSYAERCLNSIVEIVLASVKNASAFECIVQTLKDSRFEKKKNMDSAEESSPLVDSLAQKNANTFSVNAVNVTVPAVKNPTGAFGTFLGNSAKRKNILTDKEKVKLEKIRLSFPFICGKDIVQKTDCLEATKCLVENPMNWKEAFVESPKCEDVIALETEDEGQSGNSNGADLSQGLEKCMQTGGQQSGVKFRSFDYSGASKFWETSLKGSQKGGPEGVGFAADKEDVNRDFGAPRRRQAFPATGNRSATFRQ